MTAEIIASRHPADHDVVVLAGGLGTRLRGAIGALPKILAPVAGRPFLDILLDHIARHGFRRVILLLGYRADAVRAHLASRPSALDVEIFVETTPLGTAGALRTAVPHVQSDPVLVMNGDSFVQFDAVAFLDAYQRSGAPAALVSVMVPDASRYGALDIDSDERVVRFLEKRPGGGPGPINAGGLSAEPPVSRDHAAERRPVVRARCARAAAARNAAVASNPRAVSRYRHAGKPDAGPDRTRA
ncbi:MAG: sugar phosphate nucleotidyltransferase [Pseudomonadota bacterium]